MKSVATLKAGGSPARDQGSAGLRPDAGATPAPPRPVEPRILIVGYGNPLRGDDGAGWSAAERLDELLPADQACVLIRHQLTPELAEPASRMDLVIFIDASCTQRPGEIACGPVMPTDKNAISLLHELNPRQLLGSARDLFGRCAEGIIYSIGGESFELRDGLSEVVEMAVCEVVTRVKEQVKSFCRVRFSGPVAPSPGL